MTLYLPHTSFLVLLATLCLFPHGKMAISTKSGIRGAPGVEFMDLRMGLESIRSHTNRVHFSGLGTAKRAMKARRLQVLSLRGGVGSQVEPGVLPSGWKQLVGAGTWISALHAANKALICWCSEPRLYDTVIKIADVGFLGLLGTLALSAAWAPACGLRHAQTLISQVGLSHLTFECIINGLCVPHLSKDLNQTYIPVDTPTAGFQKSRSQILQQVVQQTLITKKPTGLRPDIWLHHFFAVSCFMVVLVTGEFQEEAVMLTAVECTCALPVAFTQAAKAKLLRGMRSSVLAFLMTTGFALRVALTSKLTLPRLLELVCGWLGQRRVLMSQSGQLYEGSITRWPRATLVLGSSGLTLLNILWLGKIAQGAMKVILRRTTLRKPETAAAAENDTTNNTLENTAVQKDGDNSKATAAANTSVESTSKTATKSEASHLS